MRLKIETENGNIGSSSEVQQEIYELDEEEQLLFRLPDALIQQYMKFRGIGGYQQDIQIQQILEVKQKIEQGDLQEVIPILKDHNVQSEWPHIIVIMMKQVFSDYLSAGDVQNGIKYLREVLRPESEAYCLWDAYICGKESILMDFIKPRPACFEEAQKQRHKELGCMVYRVLMKVLKIEEPRLVTVLKCAQFTIRKNSKWQINDQLLLDKLLELIPVSSNTFYSLHIILHNLLKKEENLPLPLFSNIASEVTNQIELRKNKQKQKIMTNQLFIPQRISPKFMGQFQPQAKEILQQKLERCEIDLEMLDQLVLDYHSGEKFISMHQCMDIKSFCSESVKDFFSCAQILNDFAESIRYQVSNKHKMNVSNCEHGTFSSKRKKLFDQNFQPRKVCKIDDTIDSKLENKEIAQCCCTTEQQLKNACILRMIITNLKSQKNIENIMNIINFIWPGLLNAQLQLQLSLLQYRILYLIQQKQVDKALQIFSSEVRPLVPNPQDLQTFTNLFLLQSVDEDLKEQTETVIYLLYKSVRFYSSADFEPKLISTMRYILYMSELNLTVSGKILFEMVTGIKGIMNMKWPRQKNDNGNCLQMDSFHKLSKSLKSRWMLCEVVSQKYSQIVQDVYNEKFMYSNTRNLILANGNRRMIPKKNISYIKYISLTYISSIDSCVAKIGAIVANINCRIKVLNEEGFGCLFYCNLINGVNLVNGLIDDLNSNIQSINSSNNNSFNQLLGDSVDKIGNIILEIKDSMNFLKVDNNEAHSTSNSSADNNWLRQARQNILISRNSSNIKLQSGVFGGVTLSGCPQGDDEKLSEVEVVQQFFKLQRVHKTREPIYEVRNRDNLIFFSSDEDVEDEEDEDLESSGLTMEDAESMDVSIANTELVEFSQEGRESEGASEGGSGVIDMIMEISRLPRQQAIDLLAQFGGDPQAALGSLFA